MTNIGTGVGRTTRWTDRVYLSTNSTLDTGNSPDLLIDTVVHDGPLDSLAYYDMQREILLPHSLSDQYYIIVKTDFDGEVFENGLDVGNTSTASNNIGMSALTDIARARYADLTVTDLTFERQERSADNR